MSQHTTGHRRIRSKRALWPRIALAVQMLGLVGCNSLGVPHAPATSNLFRATSPKTTAPVISNRERPSQPATATLRDDSQHVNQNVNGLRTEIEQVSYQEPVQSVATVTQASYHACGKCAANGESCGCTHPEATCVNGPKFSDEQEYIFDGGDMDPALVVRRDASVAGLNPTDTVAYYETYDGKLCVTPTNRVPIYAPRFGAVRKITGVVQSEQALSTQRIYSPITPARFDDKNLASSVTQPLAPQGEERVSLIDAFQDRNLGVPIAQILPPQRMSDAIVPFENLEFFRTGLLQEKEIAVLGQFFANARTWETPESLEVLIDGKQAEILVDLKQAQDVHVYELPPGKCSLRICKAASHMVANSGDEISFTLRFDNIGAHPIEKVVILDSLSPRLEYIEESQQCSIKPSPEFLSEPNEVGSTNLRWEFKSAIKPGEGGVLHFRCLVR